MADSHTAASARRFEVRASASDHFAWVRTRVALEPTIMSWLRAAVRTAAATAATASVYAASTYNYYLPPYYRLFAY